MPLGNPSTPCRGKHSTLLQAALGSAHAMGEYNLEAALTALDPAQPDTA